MSAFSFANAWDDSSDSSRWSLLGFNEPRVLCVLCKFVCEDVSATLTLEDSIAGSYSPRLVCVLFILGERIVEVGDIRSGACDHTLIRSTIKSESPVSEDVSFTSTLSLFYTLGFPECSLL